jgi:hypothetical protein
MSRENKRFFFISFFFLFFFVIPCSAVIQDRLIIVEVQIAGEKTNNDFIKIYNPLDNDLDISGYKLMKKSSTGSESLIKVFPSGSILSAKSYFLWANSDDNYASLIGANIWSTATLAKNNSVALFSPDEAIFDALSWGKSNNSFFEELSFPENPIPNQKLERKKINDDYQDTNNNSQDFCLNPPYQSPPVQDSITAEEIQTNYPIGVIINEILPSPVGPDETDEWIEISNTNNFELDLSFWQITDTTGKTTVYTFPKGAIISPQDFLVLKRPETKITLNNNSDGLNLLQPDGKITDSLSYEKTTKGQSYNRFGDKWLWSENLTPGAINIIPTPVPTTGDNKLSEENPNGLAVIGKNIRRLNFPSFLAAFGVAVFSGTIILVIKKLVKK